MTTHSKVVRLNLEYYRKQAKALLKSAKSGDTHALARLTGHSNNLSKGSDATSTAAALHDAQFAIAREQGFASWPRFKEFLVQSNLDFQGSVASFIDVALSDLSRATEMLASHAELAGAGVYAALVLGDVEKLRRVLDDDATFASTKGGPRNWEPLLYVCFSRFANGKSSRAGDILETAKLLLQRGADANASYLHDGDDSNSLLSCLYGATGLNNSPALGLALLEAGANPDDGESLYHSTEHADLTCLKLLLEHGASPTNPNVLNHMLDREDPKGLRMLLDAAANPNNVNQRGETSLHWAVWRGRSAKMIELLLDKGALLDTRRKDGRTAYAMAVQTGQTEVAELLKQRGANTEISALDRFVGACAGAQPEELERLMGEIPPTVLDPENEHLLPDMVMNDKVCGVLGLLAAGLPIGARGELGATALHWACWKGYANIAKLLLERGASLIVEDSEYHGTPPHWFCHGLKNCGEAGGDYAEVARLLIAAGAVIPAVNLPTGNAELDAVLREHGLIT